MAKCPERKGKRVPLNMKTTREIRDLMDKAASESGRSLAQEVEYRLQASFDREAMLNDMRAVLAEQRSNGPDDQLLEAFRQTPIRQQETAVASFTAPYQQPWKRYVDLLNGTSPPRAGEEISG
jgi:uncharacterized protein (DUF1778 family)